MTLFMADETNKSAARTLFLQARRETLRSLSRFDYTVRTFFLTRRPVDPPIRYLRFYSYIKRRPRHVIIAHESVATLEITAERGP